MPSAISPQAATGPHVALQTCVMRILITDGNERVALAVARSLTRARHAVVVTAPTRLSLAGVSRGIRPRALRADPLAEPAQYAAARWPLCLGRHSPSCCSDRSAVWVRAFSRCAGVVG